MAQTISRRNTKQRSIILEELRQTKAHPTAELLFEMVKRRIPSISFATVYRNLNLLRDEGHILELTGERTRSRYDGDTRQHHHFFCVKCQSVTDLDAAVARGIDEQLTRSLGLEVIYHRIDLFGKCKECQKQPNQI
jgi:Fe2+ or Zn2+ uptake regulation protein